MPQSVLAHDLASTSHTKHFREVSSAAPDLRRYAAFANTLDTVIGWIHDDMQRNVQDDMQQMIQDSLRTAPLNKQGQQEMCWDLAVGKSAEILNNTNQEAQCEAIKRMPGDAEDGVSAENLQELESRINNKLEIRETLDELGIINPQFQKEFKIHVTERALESGEVAEEDDEWEKDYEDEDTEKEDDNDNGNDPGEEGQESNDDGNDDDSSSDGSIDYLRMITSSTRMDEANTSTRSLNNNSSNRTSQLYKLHPYPRQLSTIFEGEEYVMSTHLSPANCSEDPVPKGKTSFGSFHLFRMSHCCGTAKRLEDAECTQMSVGNTPATLDQNDIVQPLSTESKETITMCSYPSGSSLSKLRNSLK